MKTFIKILVILAVLFTCIGCKTKTIFVPVESLRTEYIEKIHRDSIYQHDSIIFKVAGDTFFVEKYRYLYKDRIIIDSVCRIDSICVPYPVEIPIEVNRLKWYQEVLMWSGVVFILLLIIVITIKVKKL